jgi:anti-sigma regulatory factor (Ser/Thr protein kinase)
MCGAPSGGYPATRERDMDVQLLLRVPAGPNAAVTARRAVAGLRSLLDQEMFENAKLLMTELTTNSVRHAGLTPEEFLTVQVSCDEDHVRIEVMDAGPQFEVDLKRHADIASGWGLYLVSQIADRWGVEHERGNRVWFELGKAG